MTVLSFNRTTTAFDLVSKHDTCYLAIDPIKGITATTSQELAASCDLVMQRLVSDLEQFSFKNEAEELPKRGLALLKEKSIAYFKNKLGEGDRSLRALECTFFPIAEITWKYMRGLANFKQIVANPGDHRDSMHGQQLLREMPRSVKEYDIELLVFPRDVLFLKGQLQYYLKLFSLIQLAIAERINHEIATRVTVTCDGQEPIFFFGDDAAGDVERGLQCEIKRVSRRIVQKGILERPGFVVTGVTQLMQKLLSYKKNDSHSPEFYQQCLKILEINELFSMHKQLLADWHRQKFSSGGFTNVESDKKLFDTISYLPRRELMFLRKAGKKFIEQLELLESDPLVMRFEEQEKLAKQYCKIFTRFETEADVTTYSKLANRITELANRVKTNRLDIYGFYHEVCVVSTEYDSDDEEFEEYIWKDTGAEQYVALAEATKSLDDGLVLVVPSVVARCEAKGPDESRDRGFAVAMPPRAKQPQLISKKKRKKSLTPPSASDSSCDSSRSSSPGSPPAAPTVLVDTLALDVAKLALNKPIRQATQPKKVVRVLSAQPQESKPQEVSAKLKYDVRVLRWFRQSDILQTDPEYSGKTYGPSQEKWIYVEHNFARFADFYLLHGAADTDKARLSRLGACERIQLVGDITIKFPHGDETKRGTFTYSKGLDGLFYHRCFAPFDREEVIDQAYAEQAGKVLDLAETPKEYNTKPQLVTKDGSCKQSEADDLVVLVDSKNRAIVRLVKCSPHSIK